jgi:hypothetical protein
MNAKTSKTNVISMPDNAIDADAGADVIRATIANFCDKTDLFSLSDVGTNVYLTHKKGGIAGGTSETVVTVPKTLSKLSWESMLDVTVTRTFRGVDGTHSQNISVTLGFLLSQSLNGLNETSYTNVKTVGELEEYGRALEAGHLTRASYKSSFRPFDMKEWLSELEKDETITAAQRTFWVKVRDARRGMPALVGFLNDICLKQDAELKNSLWLKDRLLSAGYVPSVQEAAPDLY